jgi:hypothetical protein
MRRAHMLSLTMALLAILAACSDLDPVGPEAPLALPQFNTGTGPLGGIFDVLDTDGNSILGTPAYYIASGPSADVMHDCANVQQSEGLTFFECYPYVFGASLLFQREYNSDDRHCLLDDVLPFRLNPYCFSHSIRPTDYPAEWTIWARGTALATTTSPSGQLYAFDHWQNSGNCVEGTSTGLACTFSAPVIGGVGGSTPFRMAAVFREVTGYEFGGILPPINPSGLNLVKAGQAVPVKFSLGGDHGLNVFASGYPQSQPLLSCAADDPPGTIEETASAGASGLSYDADTNLYTYVWKTEKAWVDSCRQLTLRLTDGSEYAATFSFAK